MKTKNRTQLSPVPDNGEFRIRISWLKNDHKKERKKERKTGRKSWLTNKQKMVCTAKLSPTFLTIITKYFDTSTALTHYNLFCDIIYEKSHHKSLFKIIIKRLFSICIWGLILGSNYKIEQTINVVITILFLNRLSPHVYLIVLITNSSTEQVFKIPIFKLNLKM